MAWLIAVAMPRILFCACDGLQDHQALKSRNYVDLDVLLGLHFGLLSRRRRFTCQLACGSSWSLLFAQPATLKFWLWLHTPQFSLLKLWTRRSLVKIFAPHDVKVGYKVALKPNMPWVRGLANCDVSPQASNSQIP